MFPIAYIVLNEILFRSLLYHYVSVTLDTYDVLRILLFLFLVMVSIPKMLYFPFPSFNS